jgi:glutaminyl-tRNA synthetase
MFVELSGISKAQSVSDYQMLEYCVREDLKLKKSRVMAILHPLKLIIDNYPEGQTELLPMPNNLENPELGERMIPFSRELWIEEEDFMEVPPKKYFRLFPGNEVRLMGAYFVKCVGVDKDADGKITAVHCTYDPETKNGSGFTGRKVKGTIHWLYQGNALPAEIRLYENIVQEELGVYNEDGSLNLNPNSLTVLDNAFVEKSMETTEPGASFQFVRQGFFTADIKTYSKERRVFNRIVSLKSSFKLPAKQ